MFKLECGCIGFVLSIEQKLFFTVLPCDCQRQLIGATHYTSETMVECTEEERSMVDEYIKNMYTNDRKFRKLKFLLK